jgi:hypothetical protein
MMRLLAALAPITLNISAKKIPRRKLAENLLAQDPESDPDVFRSGSGQKSSESATLVHNTVAEPENFMWSRSRAL